MTEARKLLTVETCYLDSNPLTARAGLHDVRFVWDGVEYRRGVIRPGEPEDLYVITRKDDDGSFQLEIYGRAEKAYQGFEGGGAEVPPLERFVFLLPAHPLGPYQAFESAWHNPDLIEHEVVTA